MKRTIQILVSILLILIVFASIFWYFLIYDRNFTQELLLNLARAADNRGNHKTSTWYYNLAYRHSNEDEQVAIELAEQFKSIGNYTKAEYTLTNAISDGGSADLYIALCKTYVEQDKLLDAVTMLDNIADPAIKAELDLQRPVAPTSKRYVEADEPDPQLPVPPTQNSENDNNENNIYSEYIDVEFTSHGGKLYVTDDGKYPSVNTQPYSTPIKLESGTTNFQAITVGDNGLVSPLYQCSYTVTRVIEEVTIENSALDSIVRAELGISSAHTLLSNQLWNVTSLEITKDVQDLAELVKMPYLEKLILHQGAYENLTCIAELTALTTLAIDGVTLDTAELSAIASLPNLTSLSLVRCNLSSVSKLSNSVNLIQLDLSNNTLRDLEPISNLPELEYLNLSNNAVTQLTALTNSVKLKELDVSNNSINSTVALSGCISLETLRIDNNNLVDLDGLDKLAKLKNLYATNNQISNIEHLATLSQLTELDLSNNALMDLSVLNGNKSLMVLLFENNQVTELPTFDAESVLSTINGTRNNLSNIDTLAKLTRLNYVFMNYNSEIASIDAFSQSLALVQIDILGTSVTDISALEKLKEQGIIINYAPI